MNKEELRHILQVSQIPERMYNLDGEGRNDERFCLEKHDGKWNVYFSERGVKTTNELFDSEHSACQFILNQLVY